jgi:hypothetical protein
MFTNSLGKFVLASHIMKNKCARKESMWKPISFLKPKVISRVAKKISTIFMVSCHLRAIYHQGWKCFY